jgi:hypothetical protein
MIYYHKKIHAVCFDPADLKQIFEAPWRKLLEEEILRRGYSSEDLLRNGKEKMIEIVNATNNLQDKEDIEIFSALYVFLKFFSEKDQVCFLLKDGVSAKVENIDSMEKLKESLKENDLTDFGLMNDDGYRAFQLKQYKGKADPKELFAFMEKKLRHYGNNMGDVNLLVVLQSQGAIEENFFEDLHANLKTLKLNGSGHILVSYNEDNKFDVLNTVYPTLGTTRIKHELFNQDDPFK